MNTTHSALPFRAGGASYGGTASILDRDGTIIATISRVNDNWRENAQFIITACNSHAALLGALETLLEDYQSLFQAYSDELIEQGITASSEKSEAVTEQARQALALAKGVRS